MATRINPRDEMRNLLQALNARYEVSGEAPAAHSYATLARAFARASSRWAKLIDPYTAPCDDCGRDVPASTLTVHSNGAELCPTCGGI